MNHDTDKLPARYNVFAHGKGTKVIGSKSGKRGEVLEVKETAYEWIEPLIKWDDGEVSFAREELYLREEA